MSSKQFMEMLYGKLPEFFTNEAELRTFWSVPDTRKKLLEGLAEKGFVINAPLHCWDRTTWCSGIRQNSQCFGVPRNSGESHYGQIPALKRGIVCYWGVQTTVAVSITAGCFGLSF